MVTHGFTFVTTEPMRGHWAVTAKLLGCEVWSAVGIEAEDEIEATGRGIHMFAARLREALADPPEYDGE